MTVRVVTDSTASLPSELARESGVEVVPMWLHLGRTSVRDGELPLAEVVQRLDEGLTTAGPTPGEFAQAIEAVDEGDGVVVATLSSRMSVTYDSARLAAAASAPRRVVALDTATAAAAQGLVVLEAARAARAGGDIDAVVAAARRVMDCVRLVATVPALDQLARSGRVPGAAVWAGRWLGLNPLFQFSGGRAVPLRPAIGSAAALERIVALWERRVRPGGALHVAAMHALAPESARHLLDAVEAEVLPASSFVGSFSPVMVAHTGPGLVGLAWWWDDGLPSRGRSGRSAAHGEDPLDR